MDLGKVLAGVFILFCAAITCIVLGLHTDHSGQDKNQLIKDLVVMNQTYREIMVRHGIAEWKIVDAKTGKTSFTLTLQK
jgi:hypothetical protein